VVLGVDGVSDFNALHSRKYDHEVQLYAFDCLAYNGDDLSRLRLHLRKTNLAHLLRGRSEGTFVAPFEQGEIGPDLFEAACRMGLEGLVSKHRERVYRGGRCDHRIKVKSGASQRSPASRASSRSLSASIPHSAASDATVRFAITPRKSLATWA
jgi:bifunctional non-homologous end joining protein LigD